MRIIDINAYDSGYNMLGVAVHTLNKHLLFVRSGPGDNLFEIDSNGTLVASVELVKDGVTYGTPQGLASSENNQLYVSRPVYDGDAVIDCHLIQMNSDGLAITSTFPDQVYSFGGNGISYSRDTKHVYISSFRDMKVYEVNGNGVLMDYFETRSGPSDIAYDHMTGNIFVVHDNDINFRGIIDEYAKTGFRDYTLVNSYTIKSVGIDSHPMALDIDKDNGLFYILENNHRIVEFDRDEMRLAEAVTFEAGRTLNSVSDAWHAIPFASAFAATPVVVATIETFNGTDTAGLRIKDLSSEGFSVKIEEECSANAETAHVSEVVGYVSMEGETLLDHLRNPFGEAGTTTVNQQNRGMWHTVELQNTYRDPVVIMQLMSMKGNQPSHMRIRNVESNAFEFKIEEWDYLDQRHVSESIGYLVIDRGRHRLVDGTVVEAGKINTNHNWAAVSFDATFTSPPVTLCHCQSFAGNRAVVTRQKDLSLSGFKVRLQEQEANNNTHPVETIGYIAIQHHVA